MSNEPKEQIPNDDNEDDEDYLAAPGGIIEKQKQKQIQESNNNNNIDNNNDNILNIDIDEQKHNNNKTDSKLNPIAYGLSYDTTHSSSEDEDIDDGQRKFTSHNDEEEENDDTISSAKKTNGRQYKILLNDKSFLEDPDVEYPSNYIKTSKYTIFTFIPLNLFEQFRRIANIYFLLIIAIQTIPGASPFPIETSIFPLAFILIVGAIKDGIEDYDRYKSDKIANSLPILRLNNNVFSQTISSALQPSDIILIKREQEIPADCIVLSTDSNHENHGVCYINTASMDGENAPKLRRANRYTVDITKSMQLQKIKGTVKCPSNTKSLHGFTAVLDLKKSTLPVSVTVNNNNKSKLNNNNSKLSNNNNEKDKLNTTNTKDYGTIIDDDDYDNDDNDNLSAPSKDNKKNRFSSSDNANIISGLSDVNFIYRGSKLVNTEYIHALVLFTGRETKLMLNRNQVPFKFSKFERILNLCIGSILIFNFLLCIIYGMLANIVIQPFDELKRDNWFTSFLLDACSWLILTSWMIPFSLYVTMELVKMIQAQWIAWDTKMTYQYDSDITNDISSNNNNNNDGYPDIHRPASISVDSVNTVSNGTPTNTNNKNGKNLKTPHQQRQSDSASISSMRSSMSSYFAGDNNEYDKSIRHAKVKNSNLNEELGHIDYIFTDKTGTLTQNLMELSQCSIGGNKFKNDHQRSTLNAEKNNNQTGVKVNPNRINTKEFKSFSELVNKVIKNLQKKNEIKKTKKDNKDNNNNKDNNKDNNNNNSNNKDNKYNYESLTSNISTKNNTKSSYSRTGNKLSSFNQLQHDTHFLLNLLLCSSTLPSTKKQRTSVYTNDNNSSNKQYPADNLTLHQNMVASASRDALEDIKENEMNNVDNINIDDKINNIGNDYIERESLEFMSPSPDEVAFAEALSDHGIILEERGADGTITIRFIVKDHHHHHHKKMKKRKEKSFTLKFKILATLDFDARRKRMTVIFEDCSDGSIHLYCKGADVTIFRLCNSESKSLIHLTKRHVTSFARGGSRTLVMGWKSLSIEEYDEFDRYYREAEISLNNRQELIENSFSYIEHSLYLLGCTAVEDQMQEYVPLSIYKLKEASIKIIMLTGDKQETAVSIGRQSLIISSTIPDNELMFISATTPKDSKDIDLLEKQMRRVDKKLNTFIIQCQTSSNKNLKDNGSDNINIEYALILNGDALEMCLHPSLLDKFTILFEYCSTIICNRCNPSQKAMLVLMARNNLSGIALAIGDGANDVSMIQSSNVGIGIMGKEGTQASLAADFVIHRFHHIIRLLFIHGRYSFLRTSQVALLSLYKNMVFNLPLCYYGFYSLFTAQPCFDSYMMSAFNILFTSLFPLAVGSFEQDIRQNTCINHPTAYYYFKTSKFNFNFKYFLFWMWTSFWQSLLFFGISIIIYYDSYNIWNINGQNNGLFVFGTQMLTASVLIICFKMFIETKHWNITYFLTTICGILLYFISLSIVSNLITYDTDMYQIINYTFNTNINWLILLIQIVLCIGPGILYNLYKRERYASLSNILFEAQKFGYLTQNGGVHRPTSDVVQDYMRR